MTLGKSLRAPAVCCSVWFGVVSEPVLETRRAEARVIAGGEALIVHRDAEVERLGIGDYRPYVPGCVQELPHEVVLSESVRARPDRTCRSTAQRGPHRP